ILKAGSHLRHLHMANPTGRVFPLSWDEYDYAAFFANLRTIGYSGRMSIEASTKDMAIEGPQAIALLRRAFAGSVSALGFQGPQRAASRAREGQARLPPEPRSNVGPADRPRVDPVAAVRGAHVWGVECVTCHGAKARGTDNGPNLLRSPLILHDRAG